MTLVTSVQLTLVSPATVIFQPEGSAAVAVAPMPLKFSEYVVVVKEICAEAVCEKTGNATMAARTLMALRLGE